MSVALSTNMHSAQRRLSSTAGSTLVEVLIATLVLIVGLVAMAQLLTVATVMHAEARAATTATLAAQDKLEELNAAGFDAPSLQVTGGDTLTGDVPGSFDRHGTGISRRWQVRPGPTASTRIVRVRAFSKRALQPGGQIDLITIVRRR